MISPSNTNPCLTAVVAVCSDPTIKIDTTSLYPGAHSYFRVIASDIQQGEIDAYVAAKVLNATKVYVIDDQEAYGRGLALIFTKAFTTTEGGSVVGSASLPGSTTTFATQISNAQADGAQAIFFGGTSGNGCGLVRRDMGKAGLNIPLLGGDGCQDTKFIADANSGSNTTEALAATRPAPLTSPSSPARRPSSPSTRRRTRAKPAPYNDGTKEPYTAYGYDAMNILLQAIHSVLVANGGQPPSEHQAFRDAVVAAACTRPRTTARSVTRPSTPTGTRPTPVSPCIRFRVAVGRVTAPTPLTPAATSP